MCEWNYKYSALYKFLKREYYYKPIKSKEKLLNIKIKKLKQKSSPLKNEITFY
jgi:septation ring formation regulator EzrA